MMGTVVFRGVPNQPESAFRSASAAVSVGSSMVAARRCGRPGGSGGRRLVDDRAHDDPNANTPRPVRVKPAWIWPSPGTSGSPLSSRVTESGNVIWPSRLTSGYVLPGEARPSRRTVAVDRVGVYE